MGLEKYRITEQSEDETLTFYDESKQPIGIVGREDGINRGLLLEAVQLWVINPETAQVLMQRRSKSKKSNPGKIDVSVSGHVKQNETPTQAMLREAREEIGLTDAEYLCSKMQKFAEDQIDLRKFGRQGNYAMTFFVAFLNNSLDSYKKDDNELESLFFMDYEELKKRVRENDSEMLIPKSDKTEAIFAILDEKIQKRSLVPENEQEK